MRRWLSLGLLLVGACGAPGAPPAGNKPSLETVEVTSAPDAALSTAEDTLERRAAPGELAGALPAGFPAAIPVYRPSSLIEAGELPGGWRFVELESPDPPESVRATMRRRLTAGGWESGTGDEARRGPLRLRWSVASQAAGSRLRLEFDDGARQ